MLVHKQNKWKCKIHAFVKAYKTRTATDLIIILTVERVKYYILKTLTGYASSEYVNSIKHVNSTKFRQAIYI